jgi:hypothetical protein
MARGRSIAPRSQAATGRALVSSARGCNVCTARADVAQLVEQRFVIQERVFLAGFHRVAHRRGRK